MCVLSHSFEKLKEVKERRKVGRKGGRKVSPSNQTSFLGIANPDQVLGDLEEKWSGLGQVAKSSTHNICEYSTAKQFSKVIEPIYSLISSV